MQAFQTAVEYADKLDAGIMHNGNGDENGHEPLKPNGENGSAKKRGTRPPIPLRTSITQYSPYELVQLIQWVSSDGQLRTDEEIVTEVVSVLGFSRRGARIEAAINRALQMHRAATPRLSPS